MSRDIPFYQVDAFASAPFEGNQACVMPLEDGFLPDETLQKIAAENNVAETAFIVPAGDGLWDLRWFTPAVEVPLCGHATLAAAHVLFAEDGYGGDVVTFRTRMAGDLHVSKTAGRYVMDFPAARPVEVQDSQHIAEALGAKPVRAWSGPYVAVQLSAPDEVTAAAPDFRALSEVVMDTGDPQYLPGTVAVFALGGDGVDVTSRFFGPGAGIDEDPATGSWHCMLAVIVNALTGAETLECGQAYPSRGARIGTRLVGDRVHLSGQAVSVIRGTFTLPA